MVGSIELAFCLGRFRYTCEVRAAWRWTLRRSDVRRVATDRASDTDNCRALPITQTAGKPTDGKYLVIQVMSLMSLIGYLNELIDDSMGFHVSQQFNPLFNWTSAPLSIGRNIFCARADGPAGPGGPTRARKNASTN